MNTAIDNVTFIHTLFDLVWFVLFIGAHGRGTLRVVAPLRIPPAS